MEPRQNESARANRPPEPPVGAPPAPGPMMPEPDAARSAGETMLEGVAPVLTMWRVTAIDIPTRVGAEVTGFMMHRLQAQAEQWACLARCRSFDEVLERQTSFARTAMAEYTTEATTIVEDITDVLNAKLQ